MRYHQCRLRENSSERPRQTVAWIEERGAKVGALVEIPDYGSFWEVQTVSKFSFDARDLKTKQDRDRGAFASLVK